MIGKDKDLKQYPLPDWEPVQFNTHGGNVFVLPSTSDKTGHIILDTLKFLQPHSGSPESAPLQ